MRGTVYRRCRSCSKSFKPVPGSKRKTCADHPTDPGSWAYSVDIAPPGSPRKKKLRSGFLTEAAAKAALAEVAAQVDDGGYREPTRLTVGEWVTEWHADRERRVRPTTFAMERPHISRHILDRPLADVPMASLHPRHIHDLDRQLIAEGLRPKTRLNILGLVNRAMVDAIGLGLITTNPVPPVAKLVREELRQEMDAPDAPEPTVWEPHEVAAFLDACREQKPAALHSLMVTLATTGLRRSEALALRVEDIDFDAATASITQTLIGVDGDQPVFGAVKSRGSRRVVGLSPAVLDLLRQHIMRRPVTPVHGLLFTWEDGSPLKPDWASRTFRRIADRLTAGGQVRAGARLHDLRHAWASTAEDIGVPRKIVTDQVGHHSERFTGAAYVHAREGARQRAATAVSDAYGIGG